MQKNNKKVPCRLLKYQRSYDKWSVGFDWLRVKINDSYDLKNFEKWTEKLFLADFDNSNFTHIFNSDYTITFVRIKT
jgi:hypothetical protein